MFNNFSFENRAVYEIILKNIVQPEMTQMKVTSMRIECSIPKATNTRSQYVALIAFPCNHGYKNSHRCFVIRTLPVLFNLLFPGIIKTITSVKNIVRNIVHPNQQSSYIYRP
jgi:hypothetical protein